MAATKNEALKAFSAGSRPIKPNTQAGKYPSWAATRRDVTSFHARLLSSLLMRRPMQLARKILAIVLALWLPTSVVASVVMPFCKHALGTSRVEQTVLHDPGSHHPSGSEHLADVQQTPDAGSEERHDAGIGCDDCGLCHLAASSAIPTKAFAPALAVASRVSFVYAIPVLPLTSDSLQHVPIVSFL